MLKPDFGWILFFIFTLVFCLWVEWAVLAIVTIGVGVMTFVPVVRSFFIKKHSQLGRWGQFIFNWMFVIAVSLTIVAGIKSFFVDVFRLPSNSMEMTIGNGDMVVINKLIFGPRMKPDDPNKYYRARGWRSIQRNDLIVFNFPEGDTLLVNRHTESYYSLKRKYGEFSASDADQFLGERAFKSVTRRPKYIKRVIALPGDLFEIKGGMALVNNHAVMAVPTSVRKYTDNTGKGDSILKSLGVSPYNEYLYKNQRIYEFELSLFDKHNELHNYFSLFQMKRNDPDPNIFPYTFLWNTDFYGPVMVPKKGMAIEISVDNISLYARLIDVYEDNDLEVRGKQVLVNGKPVSFYVCKMNYYWVMGDNQSHSFDSRYWGFLPENHVIGVSPLQIHFN
jgi:signal peptidase I